MAGWDELDPKPAFWNVCEPLSIQIPPTHMAVDNGVRLRHVLLPLRTRDQRLLLRYPEHDELRGAPRHAHGSNNPNLYGLRESVRVSPSRFKRDIRHELTRRRNPVRRQRQHHRRSRSRSRKSSFLFNPPITVEIERLLTHSHQGAGLGTLLAISTAFLIWQCRRNTHLKNELNEYRYLPKPGPAMTAVNGGGYPPHASMNAYSDSATPTTLRSPENPLRPATWKTFLGKTAEVNGQREEVGGREVLELPVNTARPSGSPAASSSTQPRQMNTSSEGSTL